MKTSSSSAAQSAALRKEEEDLAKAIALSIKESTSSQSLNKQSGSGNSKKKDSAVSSLYGSINLNTRQSEKQKVKALYDFEAVEDNEITFKAGDILFVTDSSDQNWWKGIDQNRKEGLFPSNFVTSDLNYEEETFDSSSNSKKVSFDDQVNVKVLDNEVQTSQKNVQILIDEKKIDDCIELLQNADPTGEVQPDTQEMLQLEDQCYMMGPLIDQQLQKIDYKHAILDDLNIKIIEAFQMYNNLMKESITKTSGFGPMINANNFNPNMAQQNPGNFIPFGAPPQADANLANQLNNFASYTTNMPQNPQAVAPNEIQQNVVSQDQFNTQNLSNAYPNFGNNMYQQYGQVQAPQVDMPNPNMMPNPSNVYMNNPNAVQQIGQYGTMPSQ